MAAKATTFKQFLADDYSIQVAVPFELAEEILAWGDKTIPDSIILDHVAHPTLGREDEPHITILYRLHLDHLKMSCHALKYTKSPQIILGKTSLFTHNDHFDVLKIDVESADLHKIQQNLLTEMKINGQYLHYIPHITVAFLKKNTGHFLIDNDYFAEKCFTVQEVNFSSRNGNKIKINLGE